MTTIHLHKTTDLGSPATVIEVDGDIGVGDPYRHDGVQYVAIQQVCALNPQTRASEVVNWCFAPA